MWMALITMLDVQFASVETEVQRLAAFMMA